MTTRITTLEHLGPEATEEDLAAYNAAVANVRNALGSRAEDYIWNNGLIRFNAAICAYCGGVVEDETIVPAPADHDAWIALHDEHIPGCEWIMTRAHTSACHCGERATPRGNGVEDVCDSCFTKWTNAGEPEECPCA